MIRHRLLFALLCISGLAQAEVSLLNVSYDVSREFYEDYNPAFITYWKKKTGKKIRINQSHGGSSKQVRAITEGLEADVVTMNQASDIDFLVKQGQWVAPNWQSRLPYNSAPTTSTTVFVVRSGNPKEIRDWDDLVKPGISVIIPNPKTSGNGRYSYLAAWGAILKKTGDAKRAEEYVTRLFKNVPVLDTGGRGASTTFAQRDIGDVLLTFENEIALIRQEDKEESFDIVYPSVSVLAENPVAVIDKVVDKRHTREEAQAYLDFLYSESGQEIAAKHGLRPRLASVVARHKAQFPTVNLFTVQEVFGGWEQAQEVHFKDGGTFDRIYAAGER